MIQRIKTWFSNYRNDSEKRRRKQTLEIIKKAKQAYLDHKSPFMCVCFFKVKEAFCCYEDIVCEIPEFKPSTFGLDEDDTLCYWWPITDRESRINALTNLLKFIVSN